MARILFLPYAPQLGTLYGLIDIAQFFKKLGDEVYFAGDGKFINIAHKEGYPCYQLPEILFDDYQKFVDKGSLGMHTYESAKEYVAAELALYKDLKPDLIITQGRLTIPVSAKIANIPYVCVTVPFLTEHFVYPKRIPESFDFAVLANFPIIGKFVADNIGNYLKLMSRVWIRPFNKVLKDYKVKPFKSLYDLYKGDMATLIPEEEGLFPVKKSAAKDHFLYSGPLLHFNNFETPDWYARVKELDGDFIYLSMGSSSLTLYPKLLDRLVKIYGNVPNVYIITNTTLVISAKEKSVDLPSNFFITNMAPADQMLALADLTICHGGKGTIYHSILNDVPVLGIPHQAEQEMNLIRIKELQLGDYILAKNLSKISNEELKRRIDSVLNNKVIHKSVHKTAVAIRSCMENLDVIVRSIHTTINKRENG